MKLADFAYNVAFTVAVSFIGFMIGAGIAFSIHDSISKLIFIIKLLTQP